MIIGVCVRVSCTQIQDSLRPLRKCTKIAGEQKKDSFTHPQSCSSNCMRTYTRLHAYWHIYTYTEHVRSSFAVAKGKSGSLKAGDETWGWRGRRRTEVTGQGTQLSGIKPSRLLPTSRELPFYLSLSLFLSSFFRRHLLHPLSASSLFFLDPSLRWKDVW